MTVQLALVFFAQKNTIITMDGIFSYTLANNPYVYVFIDDIYQEFPENNGWIDAHILKENYVAETYDRFNYAAVYHHQQYDVHPPLYYFAVHTISSLFPGTYSNLFTLSINLAALFLTDIIMIRLFRLLYGGSGYGLVPMAFLLAMGTMRFLVTWARMYMLLFFFCAWYLYLHAKFLKDNWCGRDLVQMTVCIFLGTMTHYYFYVYAGALTLWHMGFLIRHAKIRELLRYLYVGAVGILSSWIFYPWVLFHIFGNEQNKHANITGWSLEKGREYAAFLKNVLFDDRALGAVVLAAVWAVGLLCGRRTERAAGKREEWQAGFRRMAMGSGLLYSLIIYTLDGGVLFYFTAFYMAFIVWVSMTLLDLCGEIPVSRQKHAVRIGMALIGVWLVCSKATVGSYLKNAQKVLSCMQEGVSCEDYFYQIPKQYQNYHCFYIEKELESLFHNYWFAFGEYRQFKKISLEEFLFHGIRREDLSGCDREGEGILVYAPKECELNDREYRRIAGDNSYYIYEYIGGVL